MAQELFSQTYVNNTTVNIPGNAGNLTLECYGGAGGDGAGTANQFGRSRGGQFTMNPSTDYNAKTIIIYPGGKGGNAGPPGAGEPNLSYSQGSGGGGGTGATSPYSYITGYTCVHVGGFCDGCPSGYNVDGNYGGCGGYCDPPRRDLGIQFCACCQNSANYATAYGGTGGGGGGSTNVYLGGNVPIRLVTVGGGGGGGGSTSYGAGAPTSTFATGAPMWYVQPGAPGAGRGAGGGTGGGGGSASTSSVGWQTASTSRYNPQLLTLDNDLGLHAEGGKVTVEYIALTPEITEFFYTGGDSSNGVPDTEIDFEFSIVDFVTATLTGPFGTVNFNSGDDLSYTWTNIPQSDVENDPSPATAQVTLTATAGDEEDTQTLNVEIFNDRVVSNSWTTSFINLPSSFENKLNLGTITGIDMPLTISVTGNGNFVGPSSQGPWSDVYNFSNGDSVFLKTISLYYNTDISGQTGIYGKPNSKIVQVTVAGNEVLDITVSTEPPVIQEIFNFPPNSDNFPFDDIDLDPNNNPLEYTTSAVLSVDEIQLNSADQATEVKVDDPNAQVSVNGGAWQDAREI